MMSTDPYTPDRGTVRYRYVDGDHSGGNRDPQAEFDRFIAKVRADALREAAEESEQITCEGHGGNDWFPSEWAGQVAGWLEHRADLIEGATNHE